MKKLKITFVIMSVVVIAISIMLIVDASEIIEETVAPVSTETPVTETDVFVEATASPVLTETPVKETEAFVDYEEAVNWVSDFSPEDVESNWKVAFDGSAIFGDQEITPEDYTMTIVQDDANVLRVEANAQNKPGIFMNTIAYRDIYIFPENATYELSGYFKIPEGIGSQHIINAAFNFVDSKEVGHSAEIFWSLDPNITGMRTGYINVRNNSGQHISLFELPKDAGWHKFMLVATANFRDGVYTIDRITVDNMSQNLDWEMPTFAKPGWPSIVQVYLEQHNSFNCAENCVGVGLWKEISLSTEIH